MSLKFKRHPPLTSTLVVYFKFSTLTYYPLNFRSQALNSKIVNAYRAWCLPIRHNKIPRIGIKISQEYPTPTVGEKL